MESIYLRGSEAVENAGYSMSSAAASIQQSVNWMSEALARHETVMRELVERMEAAIENSIEKEKGG